MFPLYNHVGKVVGFTGRILPLSAEALAKEGGQAKAEYIKTTGKYVNSPETPIFQKSKILYGFHKTKNDIREQKTAILVEGQMDFLMMWQDGVRNVIATSGTALTSEHLKTLKKIADELILSFDADEAGQTAAERGIDLASGQDMSVRVLIIDDPKMKDPADVVKEKPGHIAELLKTAKPAMEYYFYKYLYTKSGEILRQAQDKPDFQKIKKNLRIVLAKIKALPSSIEKNHWIKELSEISKMSESVLMEEMEKITDNTNLNSVKEEDVLGEPEEKFSRRDLICQRLIGLAMNDQKIKEKLKDYLEYLPDLYKKLYETDSKNLDGSLDKVRELISMRFSFENAKYKENNLEKEFDELVYELKLDYLKEKRAMLGREVSELEDAGKDKEWAEKMKEYEAVTEEIHLLKARK
jgi:DNA primase